MGWLATNNTGMAVTLSLHPIFAPFHCAKLRHTWKHTLAAIGSAFLTDYSTPLLDCFKKNQINTT
jgi:hypothetical protein